LVDVLTAASVRRVVFLSSANSRFSAGTGPVVGLQDMEERLSALDLPELVILRPTFFMENHLQAIPTIRRASFHGTPFGAHIAFPMIAARDIAQVATDALTEQTFDQPRIRELFGPRNYTMAEVTQSLGKAIGKPDLRYVQLPYEQARTDMLSLGLSTSFVDGMLQIAKNFNEGRVHAQERTPLESSTTTLEQFAVEVFKPAFERAVQTSQEHFDVSSIHGN
jgi:uncharacterized protein YbjT (DUF2867 family)